MEKYTVKKLDNKPDILVSVPGSKSMTNRALLMAALSEGTTCLSGILFSDDSRHFLGSLESLGFDVKYSEEECSATVTGMGGTIPNKTGSINVGSAGTAARFLTAMLALSDGEYDILASEQMEKRPMMPLFEALTSMGAQFTYLKEEGHLPVRVKGGAACVTNVSVDISKSTQFLSALLMTAPMLKNGLDIHITSEKTDGAYVRITRNMMQQFGCVAEYDGHDYHIAGGQAYKSGNYVVEPDVSAACYFYAMAAVTGGSAVVNHVHPGLMQGDMKFLNVLEQMGCDVFDTPQGIKVTGSLDGLSGVDVDMNDFSDQTMTLAAIAPFAKSRTRIRNVAHISLQESDRMAAIIYNLTSLGIRCEKDGDGLVIYPGECRACEIETYDDHRMAMAFSIPGLMTEGVVIKDPLCCRKTFENYFLVLDDICTKTQVGKAERKMKKIWNGDLGNGMYENPILYADYSDPDVCRVGEDYFMTASSFCNAPGLPLLHSKDLVNWKVVNYVVDKVPTERYDAPIHGCGVWAPSIRYHEGTYYVCFPMPDEGIYMCTTKDPFGKWSEPVNIRPGAGWIDPCPFWDDDGRAYLVAGVAKSRIGYKSVLNMVEMQPDGMGLIGEEVKIFDGNENDQHTIEGPKLYKRNGWYYVFAPAGGVKTGWQTVLRSRNIFGPYEYKVVMRQGNSDINGPHQGAWIDTVTGEDWFIHFQDVYAAGRIVHLQPMSWVDDWPVIGIARDGNDYGEPVKQYRKPDVGSVNQPVCEPDTSDDFKKDSLGLQWQWNANMKDGWCEFTGEGLRLNAVTGFADTPLGDLPNLLLQKWPAPQFCCVTKLDISHLESGDTTGVISMGMKYGAFTITRQDDRLNLLFVSGVQKYGKILAEQTEEDAADVETVAAKDKEIVYVRYTVRRVGKQDLNEKEKGFPLEEVLFEYSFDGENYRTAGSMNAVPGRWVGVKNGMFCIRKANGKGGYVLAKNVEYSIIK